MPNQCGQHNCENTGAFRYTWPGRDEDYVCEAHVGWLQRVAGAIGMHLQVLPLEPVAEPQEQSGD